MKALLLSLALLTAPAVGMSQTRDAGAVQAAAPVDPNTASEAALIALPGIGAVTAARIVAVRALGARFRRVEDLGAVGVRAEYLERLRPLLTFGGAR